MEENASEAQEGIHAFYTLGLTFLCGVIKFHRLLS
jgi:hypothetical protein